jgi:hypothetical protein
MASDARQRIRRPSLLAWLLVLVLPSLAAAPKTGTITGTVTDEVLSETTRIETTNREGVYPLGSVAKEILS